MLARKIISKSRTKNGEINFFKFVSLSLEKTTGKRSHLILSSGLGLGLGLSLIMTFYPTAIEAELPLSTQLPGLEISRIKSVDIGLDTPVERGSANLLPLVSLDTAAVHLESSAGIGSGRPIIIQGLNKDYGLSKLTQAQLGDEIFLIGSNDGWYRYLVVETKSINLDQLNDQLAQLGEMAILYTVNPWQKTAMVAIAKPRN